MNNLDHLDLIGGIDPKYINEAAKAPNTGRLRLRRTLIAAAACLCLVALGLAVSGKIGNKAPIAAGNTGMTAGSETEQESQGENAYAVFNGAELSGKDINGEEVPGEDPDGAADPGEVFNGATVPGEDPYTAPTPGNDTDKPVFSGAIVPGEDPGNDSTPGQGPNVRWISSYGEPDYDKDFTVENGRVVLSRSLKEAVSEYYDDTERATYYRVEVIFFKDGKKLANDSLTAIGEEKRLVIKGYTVSTEELQYEGKTTQIFWTLHATADQLLNFEPSPDIGYYIVLYDDYTGIKSEPGVVFNSSEISG